MEKLRVKNFSTKKEAANTHNISSNSNIIDIGSNLGRMRKYSMGGKCQKFCREKLSVYSKWGALIVWRNDRWREIEKRKCTNVRGEENEQDIFKHHIYSHAYNHITHEHMPAERNSCLTF